jgi:cell filamentation protein
LAKPFTIAGIVFIFVNNKLNNYFKSTFLTGMSKISIRFFDDREVRAIWDEENNKWWFSVLDIVAVLTEQNDYTKTRNYWKYLKGKFRKEKNELVSVTNQLK